ncbi:hypothetical protein [Couchioplanes caeruleus]|uniref:Uncharacterized protein n=2 Tax=Couchioplanes caeruleus TaxID=56438 RepID=A0A1K0FRP8_9ACTN|nr:hypothetical protein [Couchioplanes caeruleus]OJF15519.1 hypothetical protein BG844_04035 [Couchioplanes caeruleus subsp. caeruleus]ROP30942.1 hypothetical protein EDD30_3827 [Couchioplanes caeruleus]
MLPHPTTPTRTRWRSLLRGLLSRVRPRRLWWLGTPYRVTIAAVAAGGYVLQIHHTQGVEWVDLPRRTRVCDHPDEREFVATVAALAERGLVWVLPWQLDEHGNLTAPVVPLVREENRR